MSELNLINLAEVESKEVKWLWKPYLPAGKITILRGNPGEGKTMLALSIIAALTTGAPLFGEDEQRERAERRKQEAAERKARMKARKRDEWER